MAIREYIGARYVPRFLGTYDATTIYDALDVVDNGAGTSYIAKKTVPAGTALTNTEYWFVYGASSGAIIDINQQLAQLRDDRVLELKDRTFLFLSDSYDVMNSMVEMIVDCINPKAYTKRSVGALCFAKGPDSAHPERTFYTMLTTTQPLTDTEKANVTDVVICASGCSDKVSGETLTNAMAQLDTLLRTELTSLRKIHLYPTGWATGSSAGGRNYEYWARFNDGIYSKKAAQLGWSFIDCRRIMKTCAYVLTTDEEGVHPTTAGAQRIAECIAEAIITGSVSYAYDNPIDESNDLSYIYSPTFPSAMTDPNPDHAAPSLDTGGGNFIFVGKLLSNGSIALKETTGPARISHIYVPNDAGYFDIELTPYEVNKDIFPAENYVAHAVTTGNLKWCVFAYLYRSGSNGKLYLRLGYNNQTGDILTSSISLVFPEMILH